MLVGWAMKGERLAALLNAARHHWVGRAVACKPTLYGGG